jgi:hypothetical protein
MLTLAPSRFAQSLLSVPVASIDRFAVASPSTARVDSL